MSKPYEKTPPFTVHKVPFVLRGETRVIEYSLYVGDDGERHSTAWFGCKYGNCLVSEETNWECPNPDCDPDMDPVEDLAMKAAVAADAER
jgi:hypothetical protein